MIIEGLETGKLYFLWLTEHWHWNSSNQIIFKQPQTLSYEKSREIINQIKENMRVPI